MSVIFMLEILLVMSEFNLSPVKLIVFVRESYDIWCAIRGSASMRTSFKISDPVSIDGRTQEVG